MTNITQFTKDGQVLISQREIACLLDFVRDASKAFEEISALLTVIREKTDEDSLTRVFTDMACEKADQWEGGCLCFENVQLFDKIKQEKLGVAA